MNVKNPTDNPHLSFAYPTIDAAFKLRVRKAAKVAEVTIGEFCYRAVKRATDVLLVTEAEPALAAPEQKPRKPRKDKIYATPQEKDRAKYLRKKAAKEAAKADAAKPVEPIVPRHAEPEPANLAPEPTKKRGRPRKYQTKQECWRANYERKRDARMANYRRWATGEAWAEYGM